MPEALPTLAVYAGDDCLWQAPGVLRIRLSLQEQERLAAFRFEGDRAVYSGSRRLLRLAASYVTGVAPSDVVIEQRCPACGKQGHGRPYIRGRQDLHVSLSRTAGTAAAAVAAVPVAVDVESLKRAGADLPGNSLAFTPAEIRAFAAIPAPHRPGHAVRHWVRKEALVKLGCLTLDGMHTAEVPRHLGPAQFEAPGLPDALGTFLARFGLQAVQQPASAIGSLQAHAAAEWMDAGGDIMGIVAARSPAPPVICRLALAASTPLAAA